MRIQTKKITNKEIKLEHKKISDRINAERADLEDLRKDKKNAVLENKHFEDVQKKILKDIKFAEKQLKNVKGLVVKEETELSKLANKKLGYKDMIEELDGEKLFKENMFRTSIKKLKEEEDKVLESIVARKAKDDNDEKEYTKRIEGLDDEISFKVSKSGGLDRRMEGQAKEIEARGKDIFEIEKEINKKGSSAILKGDAVKELKEEISELEQEKEENQNQIKIIKEEAEEIKVKNKKAVKEFEEEQSKILELRKNEKQNQEGRNKLKVFI